MDEQQSKNDLREPLLGDQEKNESNEPAKQNLSMIQAMKNIFSLSIYPIIGMVFHPLYHVVNTIFAGYVEQDADIQLAALGLGTITFSSILMAVGFTFNGALSTLISQAFGQKETRLCGLYLNRQIYLNSLVFIPLALALLFSGRVFIAFGIDTVVSELAAEFIYINLPGLYLFNISNCYQRFLAGQREVRFPMVTNICSFIIHVLAVYYFTVKLGWGLRGIAISTSIHFALRFVINYILIRYSRFYKNLVSFFDPDCFVNLKPQFKMSILSVTMNIWAWWAFDVFSFIGSFMTVQIMAAQTVCRNIGLVFYMIPIGISQAAGIFVGNSIGEKNIQAGRLYAATSSLTALIWGILSVFIMLFFKQQIIYGYSKDPQVNLFVDEAFVILAYYVLIDCLQGVCQGIITGIGKQGLASIFTVIGFWALGMPTSLIYVFYFQGGIIGLWLGPSVALTFIVCSYYGVIYLTDWNKLANEAEERRQRDKQKKVTIQ